LRGSVSDRKFRAWVDALFPINYSDGFRIARARRRSQHRIVDAFSPHDDRTRDVFEIAPTDARTRESMQSNDGGGEIERNHR
jgi:hypothetical protein